MSIFWAVKLKVASPINPTCAGPSFERLSFDILKDSLSKDIPAQFESIIKLLDNLHKYQYLVPESMVRAETFSRSIRLGPNNPKVASPRSGDRPWHRKIGFRGPGPEESKDSLSKDGPAQVGVQP